MTRLSREETLDSPMDPVIGEHRGYVFQRKVYNQGFAWKDLDPASYGTEFLATIHDYQNYRQNRAHAEAVLKALAAHSPDHQQFRACYRETRTSTTPFQYAPTKPVQSMSVESLYALAMMSGDLTHVGLTEDMLPTLFAVGLNPLHNGPYPNHIVLTACAFAKSDLPRPERWFEVDYSPNGTMDKERFALCQWVNIAQKAEITIIGNNRGPTVYSRIDYRDWKPGMSYEETRRFARAFPSLTAAMRALPIK